VRRNEPRDPDEMIALARALAEYEGRDLDAE
jgi:hypothetical protein